MLRHIVNIILFIILFLILLYSNINAQSLFTSKNGKVLMTFKYLDTTLTAIDNKAIIKLDYSAARIDLTVDSRNIKTGIDSLDNMLAESDKTLHLFADLSLDYIDTKRHPKQSFTFAGTIYYNDDKSIPGKKITQLTGYGNIEHISDADEFPSCLLSMEFELETKNLKLTYPYSLIKEYIKIAVFQTILKSK